jgi:hypothetical protein
MTSAPQDRSHFHRMGLDVSRQDTPHSAVQHATLAARSANLSDMLVRIKYRLFQSTGDYGSSIGAGCV